MGAGSAAAAAAPAARRLAHSLAVSAARRPAPGCPRLRLLARRSGAAPAPEEQDRATGRPSPGPAAEAGRWRGGDSEDAEPRSAGGTGGQGSGVLAAVRGLCSPGTNFPPARWIPASLPGSGLRKPSWARGGGECRGLGERQGVRAGRGAPRRGRVRALWPQSGRNARGGEDPSAAARRGCPGEGARPPLAVWGLPPASRSEPPRARRLHAMQRAPSLQGSGRRACGARPCPPPWPAERLAAAKPQPVSCALLLFGSAKPNIYPLHFFFILSPRLTSGKSGTALWVDSPDVSPTLGGDLCSRS